MFREEWQVRMIQLLAVPGILVAYYLLMFHNGSVAAACSGSGWDDCGSVSGPGAQYSSIGPVPVALIGLLGYVLIFLLTWVRDAWNVIEDNLPELLVGIIGVGFLFTLGLTALELFVINAFCRFCLVSAVIIVAMFALSVSYLRSVNRRESV